MALRKHLRSAGLLISDEPKTKEQVLELTAELAVKTGALDGIDKAAVLGSLKKREDQGSTAFGEGVAVPHCHFEEVEDFAIGMLLLKNKGVDFDAPDGRKTDIVFFIIGPTSRRDEHIQILSSITRLVRDQTIQKQLRKADTEDEIFKILMQTPQEQAAAAEYTASSQMQIYIQNNEVFEEILELFTAEQDCSLAIFDAQPAGKYLHALPLFASFWTDDAPQDIQIISAVLPQTAVNNMIRRINSISDTTNPDSGVMITVNDLSYARGSISY